MTHAAAQKGTFTGRHMAFVIFGFFGVVITVNVTMAVISSASWTGLVVENSYVASQEFEEKRIAHEQQLAAGWASSFSFDGETARLVIADGAGAPVDLGTVSLLVNRPVGGHDDQHLVLERLADGSYLAPLQLGEGVWDAWIDAPETGKGPFELHERFKVEGASK